MRDAFGGAFMIQLFLVFIIIYVGFTAIALNYAKAFKAKSIVVEYLETNEISNLDHITAITEQQMEEYFYQEIVGKEHYIYPISYCGSNSGYPTKCFEDIGIKIEQRTSSSKNKLGVYYRVTTYFGFQMPFLDRLIAIDTGQDGPNFTGKWEVVGETRPIAFE